MIASTIQLFSKGDKSNVHFWKSRVGNIKIDVSTVHGVSTLLDKVKEFPAFFKIAADSTLELLS